MVLGTKNGQSQMISCRVPHHLKKQLDACAQAHGVSNSKIVLLALKQFLGDEKQSQEGGGGE